MEGWILAATAFAKSRTGRVVLAVSGAALLAGAAYALGRHDGVAAEKLAEAKRQRKEVQIVVRRESDAAKITQNVAAEAQAARIEVRERTVTLTKKVPYYVTRDDDAACVVPRGFVQLHDAAAAGVPGPAGGPDQAPSGYALSDVIGTLIENYGVAYDWRAEALAWRGWYGQQKARWDKRD
jgi:hypothetical protein